MYTAAHVMMYSAASSDSVTGVMTCFLMCAMLRIALLFFGIVALLDKKKCPPARLQAFGLLHTWSPSDQWVCTDQSQRSGTGV